jgi:IS5 family transposase
VKAHVAVDVSNLEVLAVVVTDDEVHDAEVFVPLVDQVLDRGVKIKRVLADGEYDSRENFDFLASQGIDAAIKLRKDAVARAEKSQARYEAVVERQELGEDGWKARHEYWLRWRAEIMFSGKRCARRAAT